MIFAACRLPLAACRLPLAACRLPLAACRLPLAACRLPHRRLRNSVGNQARSRPAISGFRRASAGDSISGSFSGIARVFSVAVFCVMASGMAAVGQTKPVSSAFDSTVCKLTVAPGAESLTAEWSYTNQWDFPLVVEKFDTSCGCLSSKAVQPTLQPGQSGKLTADFAPGHHRGLLRKSLHVRFVGHEKPVELVVEATIPSHVELSTQELVWKSDKKPEAKVIEVKSGTGKLFTITGLLGLPDNQFTILTETVEEKSHYRVAITPKSEATGQHCLQVRTDSPDTRDQVLAVFLQIRPSEAQPRAPTQTAVTK